MTHLTCPNCQSTDHTAGYGLAAGPMGSYVFCNMCNELIDFSPDLCGLDDEEVKAKILSGLNDIMVPLWGDKWDTEHHRLKEEAYNVRPT
jgi:hypothetical protein